MNQVVDISDDILPLTHTFSEGIYAREIFMPAGTIVVGHVHNTTHLNIVSTGKALLYLGNDIVELKAPFTFESLAGMRKILYIVEDMFWTTIHKTDVKDIDELENTLVDKSQSEELQLNMESIKSKLLSYKGD